MMATFIEHEHSISTGGKRPKNQTIEDVAEEMLNGLFCHYEPPSASKKRKTRGILRKPKHKRSDEGPKRSVRWSDHVMEQPLQDIKVTPERVEEDNSYNVTGVCMDAGVEAGLIPLEAAEKLKNFSGGSGCTPGMSFFTRASTPRFKNSDNKKRNEELVFDENGELAYTKPGKQKPPPLPPTPPPNKNERFIAELCGVRISLVDDDEENMKELTEKVRREYMEKLQKYTNDEDNSILREKDQNQYEDQDQESDENTEKEKRRKGRKKKDRKNSQKGVVEKKKKTKKWEGRLESGEMSDESLLESGDDWDTQDQEYPTQPNDEAGKTSSGPGRFYRRIWPLRRGRSRSASPSRQLERESKSNEELDPIEAGRASSPYTIPKKNRTRSKSPIGRTKSDDWDESIPIVPEAAVRNRNNRLSLPSRISSSNKRDDARLPPIRRSRSAERKEARQRMRETPSAAVRRSRSPKRRSQLPVVQETSMKSPSSSQGGNGNTYSQMHPAHPLVRQPSYTSADDLMERQSYITASRQAFDVDNPPLAPSADRGDRMERESLITAHREGFDTGSAVPSMTYDDMLERQSFIMANRQESNPGFAIPGRIKHQYDDILSNKQYDDMLERQSYITANRQGIDVGSLPPKMPANNAQLIDDQMERQSFITEHRHRFDGQHHQMEQGYPWGVSHTHAQPSIQQQGQQDLHAIPPVQSNKPYIQQQGQQDLHAIPHVQSNKTEQREEESGEKEEKVEELSWEERTRQAWDRIRGSFSVEASSSDEKKDEEETKEDPQQTPPPGHQSPGNLTHLHLSPGPSPQPGIATANPGLSPSPRPGQPGSIATANPALSPGGDLWRIGHPSPRSPGGDLWRIGHPSPRSSRPVRLSPSHAMTRGNLSPGNTKIVGILKKNGEGSKSPRVSFGSSNQQLMYDPHKPSPHKKKKKRAIRGTRLISGFFGKKGGAGKAEISYSNSSDTAPTHTLSQSFSGLSVSPKQNENLQYTHSGGVPYQQQQRQQWKPAQMYNGQPYAFHPNHGQHGVYLHPNNYQQSLGPGLHQQQNVRYMKPSPYLVSQNPVRMPSQQQQYVGGHQPLQGSYHHMQVHTGMPLQESQAMNLHSA